jgi:hypothetical protein
MASGIALPLSIETPRPPNRPPTQQRSAQAILRRAYTSEEAAKAQRLLEDLARRLEDDCPSEYNGC